MKVGEVIAANVPCRSIRLHYRVEVLDECHVELTVVLTGKRERWRHDEVTKAVQVEARQPREQLRMTRRPARTASMADLLGELDPNDWKMKQAGGSS